MTATLHEVAGPQWVPRDPATLHWIASGLLEFPREHLLSVARRQLSQLLSQSAVPVGRSSVVWMNALLTAIVRDNQPTPQLFPAGNSGLTCEWLVAGRHLQISVEPDGCVYWWSDAVGKAPELEVECLVRDRAAHSLVDEFAARLSVLGSQVTRRHPLAGLA